MGSKLYDDFTGHINKSLLPSTPPNKFSFDRTLIGKKKYFLVISLIDCGGKACFLNGLIFVAAQFCRLVVWLVLLIVWLVRLLVWLDDGASQEWEGAEMQWPPFVGALR